MCMERKEPRIDWHDRMKRTRGRVDRVPIAGGQRAELYCQFADARIRLTSNDLDPLAAADLERAAVSFRAAGDTDSTLRLLESAAVGFASHFGDEVRHGLIGFHLTKFWNTN